MCRCEKLCMLSPFASEAKRALARRAVAEMEFNDKEVRISLHEDEVPAKLDEVLGGSHTLQPSAAHHAFKNPRDFK